MKQLNWAILGAGGIANELATAATRMGKPIYGVANRTHETAVKFAEKYGISKVYDHVEDIFNDPKVDILYLATPHNTHYGFIKKALCSGKHVLAEKSITLNSTELEEVIALAEQKKLVLAEAMTIWHMPLYKKLWQVIASGELGKVKLITVNFGSMKPYDMTNRFFNRNLAGGALLDIGVYALSIARGFMDEQPDQIKSFMTPAPTGVDEQATILLQNSLGQMATVALSLRSRQPKRAMISCERGYIEIMAYPRSDKALIVDGTNGTRTEICEGTTEDALYYEMLDMEHAILTGDQSVMRLSLSRDVMSIMTALRSDWNLTYPEEE